MWARCNVSGDGVVTEASGGAVVGAFVGEQTRRTVDGAACDEVRRLAEAVARRDGVLARQVDVEATEVAQDVVTAYLRLGEEPENRTAWTRSATRHRLIDLARRQRRVDLEVEVAFRAQHRNGPSAGVISGLQVRQVLGVLSPKQRALLTDHLSGWSAGEIAEAYGYATAATATRTISRVLKKVRDSFSEIAYDLEPQRPY